MGEGEWARVLGAEGEDGEVAVEVDRGMIPRLLIRDLRDIVRLARRAVGGLGSGVVLLGERRRGTWQAGQAIDSLRCGKRAVDGSVEVGIVEVVLLARREVVRARARLLDMRVLGSDLLHGDNGRDMGHEAYCYWWYIIALQTLLYPTPRAFHPSISIP